MISILLASSCITPGCLNMTIGIGAYPDISPCWRYGNRFQARQFLRIFDQRTFWPPIDKSCAFTNSADTWLAIVDIVQLRLFRCYENGGVRRERLIRRLW